MTRPAHLAGEEELFPSTLPPVAADTLSQYQFLVSRLAPAGFGERLAAAHARAIGCNDPLADSLRSVEALEDVGSAAAQLAQLVDQRESLSDAQDRAAAAAIAAYKRAVATSLAGAPGHALAKAATVYLAEVQKRELAEAEERRQAEERAAELARIEAEQRARDAAARAAREAEEAAAEEAAMLAELEAVYDEERRRAHAVVQLRRRLRTTQVKELRVARALYDPQELAFAVGDFSVERCATYLEALDAAERELASS